MWVVCVRRKKDRTMAKFVDAVCADPKVMFFGILDSSSEDARNWLIEPVHMRLLSDEDGDGYYIMKALNVLPDAITRECYIDMSLPERISDYAFFLESGSLRYGYHNEFLGEIIPASALDCFGVYNLFYSKTKPEVGIDVLKEGLVIAKRKACIAEDLGYIFRDEQRFQEAAEMFRVAIEEGPSSYFVYRELAGAYAELGDSMNKEKYSAMFKRAEAGQG
jgi:hypothetical protein